MAIQSEEEMMFQEEMNEYANIEQIVLESGYNFDANIVIELPMEMAMILAKLNNPIFAYDIIEFSLRHCYDLILHNERNYDIVIKNKIRYMLNGYPSEMRSIIKTYLDTLVYSIETLCKNFHKGIRKYGVDTIWYLSIHREPDELDNIIEVGIMINGEE